MRREHAVYEERIKRREGGREGGGCRVEMQQRAKQASWQPESYPSNGEQEGQAVPCEELTEHFKAH